MSETTRKRGCDSCRERHLKCDRKQTCSNCAKKGQVCSRGSKIRFRHAQDASLNTGDLGFSKKQKWCKTAQRKIRFIDETYDISTLYDERISPLVGPSWEEEEGTPSTMEPQYQEIPKVTLVGKNLRPTINDDTDGVFTAIPDESPQSVIEPGLNPPTISHHESPDLNSVLLGFPPTDTQDTTRISGFPLSPDSTIGRPLANRVQSPQHEQTLLYWCDKRLTQLLRHFVENVAQLFDCGGRQRRFATSFPHRAAQYRPLLQAMSAIAAISLKVKGNPSTASEKQLCWESYQHLGLNECQTVDDMGEVQFFTTIFLNLFDDLDRYMEFSNALSPDTTPSRGQQEMHMGQITLENDLRQDMIWASLRLRLYFAVVNHEPDSVTLSIATADDSIIQQSDDHYWARRMILHLHNVVNYCFGAEKDVAAYQGLVEYSQEWVASKPASFDPILFPSDNRGEGFPEVFLLNDGAALGWQLYHLSRILLVAHDPSRPLLGPGGVVARRSIDKSLKKDAEIVCGIANSIGGTNAMYLPACMAISLTGHLFTGDSEQRALLDILVQTEKTFGWPTSTIQSHLRDAWEP